MCDPISVAATAFSAYSSIQQGKAQASVMRAEAENNNRVAEYNAKVQDQNADLQREGGRDALSRGANEAANIKQNFKSANATARAKAASTGLLVDQGSYGDLFDEGAAVGELNALTALNNAEREAYGFKLKANDYTAEARNLRLGGQVGINNAEYGAKVAKSNAFGDAAGTLVTGAAKGYSAYKKDGSLPWKWK